MDEYAVPRCDCGGELRSKELERMLVYRDIDDKGFEGAIVETEDPETGECLKFCVNGNDIHKGDDHLCKVYRCNSPKNWRKSAEP